MNPNQLREWIDEKTDLMNIVDDVIGIIALNGQKQVNVIIVVNFI